MGVVTGVVVYIMLWWLTIFMVLPWGLQRDEDGKPQDPRMKRTILITSIIAVLIWVGVYLFIDTDTVSFREMAVRDSLSEAP